MALTDLTRISTSGIATGTSLSGAILHGDAHFRGTQVGVTSALFDSSDNALEFNDNVKLTFGDSGDLLLYHTGNNSIIRDQGTGTLSLQSNGTEIALYNSANSQYMGKFANNAQVELYHAGNPKFQTTSTGAIVTGILTATSFSGPMVGNINNPSGISTFYDVRVTNNLTVEGTTTTLDTNLIGVDRVEVGANSNSVVGVAITQSGTADIVQLFDGTSQVVTIDDTGNVGIGSAIPTQKLDVVGKGRFSDDLIILNGKILTLLNDANTANVKIDCDGGARLNVKSYDKSVIQAQENWGVRFFQANEVERFAIEPTGGIVVGAGGTIKIPDNIMHVGDENTQIRFPAADQISFETGGTNRLKIHTYASNNHVEIDSSTHLSLADNGSNGRFIYMGDANASSTGYMHLQPGAGSQGFGGGIRLYSHSNSTNAGGVYIGKSLNSSGAIIFGNGGMSPSSEYLRITSDGYVHFGNTGHGTNKVGGQAITGQDYDPYIKVLASTSNHWLAQLRSDHTTGNGIFLRAGNSSSTYTLYATGYDENNPHLIVRGDGRVVLGHTAANGRLQVNSGTSSAVGDSTNPAFQIGGTANYRFAIHTTNEQAIIGNKNGDDGIAFHTKTASGGSFGEALRIGSGGGHKITCHESYYAANLTECNTGQLALNINKTRQGQTKGIALGAIGNTTDKTGIQCYDTSNNSANPLLLNPFGGNIGMEVLDPKSKLHLGASQNIRIGGQYGGMASMQQQVQYSSGYTGTHWQFKSTGGISWSFDGVLIVHGSGGSSYGSEVVHIKIVYSRESGATDSGDIWRNGTTDYNVETLEHGQVGLAPSSGDLTIDHDSTPGGSTTYSLLKLGWSSSGQGVGVWSKLIGNFYWGAPSSGDVEIQDKDANVVFNSNP